MTFHYRAGRTICDACGARIDNTTAAIDTKQVVLDVDSGESEATVRSCESRPSALGPP